MMRMNQIENDRLLYQTFITMSAPSDQVISLREARGFSVSSIDNFLEQQRQEKNPLSIPESPIPDDQTETINSLQREKTRLKEELENERKHNESLKTTLIRSLSLSQSQQTEFLMKLRELLQPARKQPAIQHALQIIGEFENQEGENTPETPRFSELSKKVQESDELMKQLKQEGATLKKQLRAKTKQKDELQSQLEDLNTQIDALIASKKKIDQNLKSMRAKFQKRNETWKAKVAELEAELEKRS